MEQAKVTNQTKGSCVYFILCSGEVLAHHTTDVRERIGIHSCRNHAIVQTTKEVWPLPLSFPVLPSPAPLPAAFISAAGVSRLQAGPCRYHQCRRMRWAVTWGTSSARVCTGECWFPKHAGGHWSMDARPLQGCKAMAEGGCKKLREQAVQGGKTISPCMLLRADHSQPLWWQMQRLHLPGKGRKAQTRAQFPSIMRLLLGPWPHGLRRPPDQAGQAIAVVPPLDSCEEEALRKDSHCWLLAPQCLNVTTSSWRD